MAVDNQNDVSQVNALDHGRCGSIFESIICSIYTAQNMSLCARYEIALWGGYHKT